ncbi:Kelch-like protein [Quillaja saponaria]|uniref:Kelch-like protein n=1 Tax=Quillaja saponaria TaxID=32244 RepID=A0AAD7LK47_QUISA|nr:Kelch-like protein [Quillaja saponaria]
MGAGRKTETYSLKEKNPPSRSVNYSASARNLRKTDLGGVIFGCKYNTIKECYFKQLFGLPASHIAYVKNIDPGLPLFLFNYSDRKLHGIFEAASSGKMNINPYGWTDNGSDLTPFGAQVKIKIQKQCQPLLEDEFRPIIANNYYEPRLFWFELDKDQTKRLISMFSSSPITASSSLSKSTEKWSTLFKAACSSKTRQVDDSFERPALDMDVTHQEQANTEGGLYKDSNGFNKENWSFEEEAAETCNEKSNVSHSYLSALQNTTTSLVHLKKSDSEWTSGNAPGASDKSGLLETTANAKAVNNHKQGGLQRSENCLQSYCSVLKSTSTSLPQKKWSALSENSFTSDTRLPELEPHVSSLEKSNREWESSYIEPYSDPWDDSWQCSEQLEGMKQHMEALNLSVAAEATDTWEDLNYDALEENTSCAKKYETHENSSCVETSLDFERHYVEAPVHDYATELSDNGGLHPHLDNNCTSLSVVSEDRTIENINKNDAWFQGIALDDVFISEKDMLLDTNASNLQLIVAEIFREVKDLKLSQLKQAQKISYLQQELAESRQEIKKLKDQQKMLECSSFTEREVVKEEPDLNHGGSMVLVGGYDGLSFLSAIDHYTPSQDLIVPLSAMSSMRLNTLAIKLNNEVFVIGGVHENLWYDTVESYNLESRCWNCCPSLNQRKGSLTGISLNEKIFAIGGGDGVQSLSEVEVLDLDVGRWIPTKSMLHKRFAPAAAEINGTIYVVGGYNGKEYLNSVERFDPREYTWRRVESMFTKRGCHSVAVLDEKLYAVGGYDGDQMVPTVEVFDPRKGLWMMGSSMNVSRGYSAAVVIGETIFSIGGLNENNAILDTVEFYKEGLGWQLTDLKAIGKRCFFCAIML